MAPFGLRIPCIFEFLEKVKYANRKFSGNSRPFFTEIQGKWQINPMMPRSTVWYRLKGIQVKFEDPEPNCKPLADCDIYNSLLNSTAEFGPAENGWTKAQILEFLQDKNCGFDEESKPKVKDLWLI